MKLLIVQLLYPTNDSLTIPTGRESDSTQHIVAGSASSLTDSAPAATAAQQARTALAIQDREVSAILIQCNTLSPQSTYSTPALTWRPDGTGVWVNSDDGIIRGIETSTGKVIAKLQGHESGSKIRCLSTASICLKEGKSKAEEWVISGGFDQKLIVWRTSP
jgi:hypothetical protein